MTADTVYELVDMAIYLATELGAGDIADTLKELAYRTTAAYEEHTGETLEPEVLEAGWSPDEEDVY